MSAAPPVSCMCLTYGRPHLLEEAIESFLRQDYCGPKELVVLNDLPEQELEFEHPEVHIINVSKRFRSVGEKRNACAALCSYDWLLPWDDDDIYLPWRISYSMEMVGGCRFFKPSRAFVFDNGAVTRILKSVFHGGSCWQRSLFDEVQGYPHMGSGEDVAIENEISQVLASQRLEFEGIPVHKIYYVYRWSCIGSYHLSALAQIRKKDESEHVMVADYVANQLASGNIASGKICLLPNWKVNYFGKVVEYIDQMKATNSS